MEQTDSLARPSAVSVGCTLGGLLVLGFLLSGRFDWSPEVRQYSIRGYLSSLFLLVPTLVTVWGLSRWLRPGHARVALASVVAAGLLLVLPYRWLGLERLHYYRQRPVAHVPEWLLKALPALRTERNAWGQDTWEATRRTPPANWRPSIVLHPPRAGESLVPAVVGLGAVLGAVWCGRRRGVSSATFGFGLLALMSVQTWAHISLNSPYSYVTHHYLPLESNHWHVAYLIGDRQGAVNADIVVFHDLEEQFWGTPRPTNTMLIRRPFFSYVVSQFSYFLNAYHVFLLLNLVAWAAAVACIYDLGRREIDETTARYAAVLTACGPGFLMYVGQPTSYLAGYAGMAFLAWATAQTMDGRRQSSATDWVTLGAILGLTLLVYDTFAWFAFVLGYAALRRRPLWLVLASLTGATFLYGGFGALQTRVLDLRMDTANSAALSAAVANLVALLAGVRLSEFYRLTLDLVRVYAGGLAGAFFVLPTVLALVGLVRPGTWRRLTFLFLLLAPSLLGVAFLCFGQAEWNGVRLASMPRFTYAAFPAVYLLAGSALATLEIALRSRGHPRLGRVLTWGLLGGAVVMANLDVLVSWPQPYYWFYWEGGGHF